MGQVILTLSIILLDIFVIVLLVMKPFLFAIIGVFLFFMGMCKDY